MAQTPRRIGIHEVVIGRVFHLQPGVERDEKRGLDQFNGPDPGLARTALHRGPPGGDGFEIGSGLPEPFGAVAGRARWDAAFGEVAGRPEGGLVEVFLNDLVDEPGGKSTVRVDGLAGGQKVERHPRPDKPGQTLGATGIGDEPQRHLGKSEPRVMERHAVMTGQRQFQPTAKSRAVDRRDPADTRRLDCEEHIRQMRRLGRFAEFPDIRTGDEGAAGTSQHRGLDGRVGVDRGDSVENALAHGLRDRVDRRIVGNDHEDVVMAFGADGGGHRFLLRHRFR